MKTIILFVLFSFSVTANNGSFCDGFKAGYTYGWSNGTSVSFFPPAPVCVIKNTSCQTYSCGFEQGYKQALKDKL
jgi:hypothetical protein